MMTNDFFIKGKKFYKDNFYMCSAFLFGIWVCFFDSNSLISQQKTKQRIKNLKRDKQYYIEQIDDIKTKFDRINSNEEQLKRFAREKYFLREEGEEIYLLKKK